MWCPTTCAGRGFGRRHLRGWGVVARGGVRQLLLDDLALARQQQRLVLGQVVLSLQRHARGSRSEPTNYTDKGMVVSRWTGSHADRAHMPRQGNQQENPQILCDESNTRAGEDARDPRRRTL